MMVSCLRCVPSVSSEKWCSISSSVSTSVKGTLLGQPQDGRRRGRGGGDAQWSVLCRFSPNLETMDPTRGGGGVLTMADVTIWTMYFGSCSTGSRSFFGHV